MDILIEAQMILEKHGYLTSNIGGPNNILYFEDETLIGFISVLPLLQNILDKWESIQDDFIKVNSRKISESNYTKAWNAYSIYLTTDNISEYSKPEVMQIEEDFRSSRKIVGSNIVTRNDIEKSLMNILPIKNYVSREVQDNIIRLREVIAIPELLDKFSAQEIAIKLLTPI